MNIKWDKRFLSLAHEVSTWSKDPRTQVGCVIVKGKEEPIVGYNGFPQNIEDSTDRLHDYELKHKLVIHAELNAIFAATRSIEGDTLYCTHPPCIRCTVNIIRKNLGRVVCLTSPPDKMKKHHVDMQLSQELFDEAGIEFFMYERDKWFPKQN